MKSDKVVWVFQSSSAEPAEHCNSTTIRISTHPGFEICNSTPMRLSHLQYAFLQDKSFFYLFQTYVSYRFLVTSSSLGVSSLRHEITHTILFNGDAYLFYQSNSFDTPRIIT